MFASTLTSAGPPASECFHRRLVRIDNPYYVALLAAFVLFAQLAPADETVTYATGTDLAGRAKATGTIVDYTGRELTLRVLGGREQAIPSDRVRGIQFERVPEHAAAEALAAEGKLTEAIVQYRAAMTADKRGWVQRIIRVAVVRCYVGLGDVERNIVDAGEIALSILQADPTTQYFDALPLGWTTHQPSPTLAAKARLWMAAEQPAARLLGASWLLSSSERELASGTLGQLTSERDLRIALLAEAQLWRTKLVTAQRADVERWQRVLAKLPEPLRAGPHYLIGQGWAKVQEPELAATALMRVPILYPHDRQLAAESLAAAGVQFERLGQTDQATSVYREVLTRYPTSEAAAEVKSKLK